MGHNVPFLFFIHHQYLNHKYYISNITCTIYNFVTVALFDVRVVFL